MKKTSLFIYLLLLFCLCTFVVVFIVSEKTTFELKGKSIVTTTVNSEYVDEGFTARVFNKDLSTYVQVKNKVDYTKPGTYTINYYLTYMGKISMLTRTVYVVDNIDEAIFSINVPYEEENLK